jgi:hypothetical protein
MEVRGWLGSGRVFFEEKKRKRREKKGRGEKEERERGQAGGGVVEIIILNYYMNEYEWQTTGDTHTHPNHITLYANPARAAQGGQASNNLPGDPTDCWEGGLCLLDACWTEDGREYAS